MLRCARQGMWVCMKNRVYRSHALRGNSFGRSGVQKETAGAVRKAPTQNVGSISNRLAPAWLFAGVCRTQTVVVMLEILRISGTNFFWGNFFSLRKKILTKTESIFIFFISQRGG
jgi:hypothetical protein